MSHNDTSEWLTASQETAQASISKLTQATIELTIPASYSWLPLLGAVAREYCATLPNLLQEEMQSRRSRVGVASGGRRFGTGTLQLPNSGATITASYSHFVYSVELILQEVATNIIRHGYGGENLDVSVHLLLSVKELDSGRFALLLELTDTGPAFDMTNKPVTMPNPLEPRESGYGLYLIDRLADKLEYSRHNDKNHLKVVKYL
jgi:anti-sigma regulatory factor (Ser/Thr protein kinase)